MLAAYRKENYYLGWMAALSGGLVHLGLGVAMFRSIDLVKRNLFEASMMCFVISVASAVRSLAAGKAK
jgi:hypothetical protein